MSFSKSYPQVYRGNNTACLMLDKYDGYMLNDSLERIQEVPTGMKRCEWTDLNLKEQTRADGLLIGRGVLKSTETLFELPEFVIHDHYLGYLISRRRVKKHRLPTYYVAGQGFRTIKEARLYVRSLPQTPVES